MVPADPRKAEEDSEAEKQRDQLSVWKRVFRLLWRPRGCKEEDCRTSLQPPKPPSAYRSSQARGQVGAMATGLHHSHSNARPADGCRGVAVAMERLSRFERCLGLADEVKVPGHTHTHTHTHTHVVPGWGFHTGFGVQLCSSGEWECPDGMLPLGSADG